MTSGSVAVNGPKAFTPNDPVGSLGSPVSHGSGKWLCIWKVTIPLEGHVPIFHWTTMIMGGRSVWWLSNIHRSIWAQLVTAFSLPVAWGGCEMSKTPSSRVRRVAALFATVLSCLLPPRAFSYTRNQPLVTSSPSGIQNHMPPTFGNSNAQFGLTGRAAVPEKYVAPRDFGGKHAEALFTAMVAGLAAYAMSHGSRNDAPKTWRLGSVFSKNLKEGNGRNEFSENATFLSSDVLVFTVINGY